MDGDLSSSLNAFKDYFNKYDTFVRLNPRLASEVEAIIRWSSYLIASRKSPILGELLSSGANLLQLCNDIILRQANSELKLDLSNVVTQLKTFLSVIQSLELLAEIYARDTFGTAGKWAIITVIQIAKAAIKLVLLLAFNQGLTKSQYIVPLDRIYYSEIVKLQEKFGSLNNQDDERKDEEKEDEDQETKPKELETSESKSIVLKSSGRRMRSITESPPKGARFGLDQAANSTMNSPFDRLQKQRLTMLLERYKEQRSATLTDRQLYGEVLHITRPLAHLALMGAFGIKSWLSFFASIAMDVSSLYLVRSPLPLTMPEEQSLLIQGQPVPECLQFSINEKMELGQRASSLLLYLLRSPFFDEYTKQRALEGLASTAGNIPLFGHFLATFVDYIPEWQKDYFRVWSD